MNIREPILSGSWYPSNPKKVDEFLLPFRKNPAGTAVKTPKTGLAAIAPHAGWYYSGEIAARSVSGLKNSADTVVIIGGHLPAGSPVLFADEDAVRTPYGLMRIDGELRDLLKKKCGGRADKYQDNTVEILVPMVHSFFPDAELLWTRFPGDLSSYETGKILAEAGKTLNRGLVVIGSTDLTHYGGNYGFSPKGSGEAALSWVKDTNDADFIRAVLDHNPEEALRCADKHAACSVGAVLGAMGFIEQIIGTEQMGIKKAELLQYGSSADRSGEIPDSFVGYASILW